MRTGRDWACPGFRVRRYDPVAEYQDSDVTAKVAVAFTRAGYLRLLIGSGS